MVELIDFNLKYGEKLVSYVKESLSDWVTSQQVVVRVMESLGKRKEEITPTSVIMNEKNCALYNIRTKGRISNHRRGSEIQDIRVSSEKI